jgi:hypothetical protein
MRLRIGLRVGAQRGARLALFAGLICSLTLPVVGIGNDKTPPTHGQMIDSGTFGIFLGGRRVGTEKFRVEQVSPERSVTTSEVSVDDGQTRAAQTSELELSGRGDLLRYSWQEQAPGHAQSVIEPGDAVLMQHITLTPNDKTVNQKYLLPTSTSILDDYFFVHREILAWRYLASVCTPTAQGLQCRQGRGQFPVLVPRQQTSSSVAMEFGGTEEVIIAGTRRTLSRFILHTAPGDPSAGAVPDTIDWTLWLDADKKLVRIVAGNVEVVRD